MYLGEYTAGDELQAFINSSNFQTGQREAAIITAFRLLVGDAYANRVTVVFSQGAYDTGVKLCVLDTTGYASGLWTIQVKVQVNMVETQTTFYFRIS